MMATPTGKLRGPQGPRLNPLNGHSMEADTLLTLERVFFSWTVMAIPWPGLILVEFSKRLRARPSTDFAVVEPLAKYEDGGGKEFLGESNAEVTPTTAISATTTNPKTVAVELVAGELPAFNVVSSLTRWGI